MITNAANALKLAPESPKPSLKSSKDCSRGETAESRPETTDEHQADGYVSISADAKDLAARAHGAHGSYGTNGAYGAYGKGGGPARSEGEAKGRVDGAAGATISEAAGAAESAEAAEAAEEMNPKEKQLKELREWAKQVEREVRLQQHKILEQLLKQSGKDADGDKGVFLVVTSDGSCVRPGDVEKAEEAQVPEYWNAENTSDRIVHFATQMAEISGMDLKEFGEIIKEAVGKGFDQANAATGELTGAAGKLNRDTRDLVFSKLSKWLEEQQAKPYNQATRSQDISTADVHDGTENHQQ